ncbi:response regulator [Microvirga sp. CF3062]|uniref:response regulator n=1 Tax=Microvirga sp. CF3062 TaxID=3110182 RepID=UPI002E771EBC|nr:response regulator [Microvirga sp. CF3062]MEE1656343.1 response regulator [Microvirga sp. CF3062]
MPSQDQSLVIVLVDEEPTIRQATARHLREASFEVVEAEDSDEALKHLENAYAVHGLVTDAHLPGRIDGHELADQARKRWPNLAVVMMSGHSDATSGPVPPGAEFVAKPYLTTHLIPTLNRLLGRGS